MRSTPHNMAIATVSQAAIKLKIVIKRLINASDAFQVPLSSIQVTVSQSADSNAWQPAYLVAAFRRALVGQDRNQLTDMVVHR